MGPESSLLESIQNGLSDALEESLDVNWVRNLHGGDINQAALIRSGNTDWFLKYHRNASRDMFAAEAQALEEISRQGCIRVPCPIAHGSDGDTTWLVLEYLEMIPRGPSALLGEQLAAMHAVTADCHGWTRDNFIGSTPQYNSCNGDWIEFWRDCRMKPQFEMAEKNVYGGRLAGPGEKLLAAMDQLLDGHNPAASLLHGDLWAGNKGFTPAGEPVIFDPATYYGDRETDIAMTGLFGGFGTEFYSAYEAHSPLPNGYQLRRELYNLYHLLNHFNLFGGGYLSRCEHIINRLLAEVR